MRTDVKIGVVVGLLLILGIAAYYVFFGGNGTVTDPNQEPNQLARTGDPPAPSGDANDGSPVLPRFGEGSTPPVRPSVRVESPPDNSLPPGPTVSPAPVVSDTNTPVVAVAPIIRDTTPPPTPIIRDTTPPITPVIDDTTPPITPVITPPPAAAPGTESTYVVQKGDGGFWVIAEKVYGDGRLWPLIAKANPGADSNTLRIGRKLKIPPKPVARPAGAGQAPAAPGGLIDAPGGKKLYVVKKGDAGFWGIAQKIYGNGKHWPLIARANPSVNSNGLQPGMKLIMPPEPVATAPALIGPAPVAGPGQKLYTVQKSDDTGFWGISRKLYGDGRYWPLIAKANPSVNSSALRVGRKLLIPELSEEARRSIPRPTTAAITRSRRRADPGGRPLFD